MARNYAIVQNSQTAHPEISKSEMENGLPTVSQAVGSSVPPVAEGTSVLGGTTSTTIVPATKKLPRVRPSARQGGAKTIESIEPYQVEALRRRSEKIDAEYADDGPIATDLPIQVAQTARRWLRSKNLAWSSNDPAFWRALEYVLGSLETFSIDAVVAALEICTVKATSNPARRSAIYAELRAARAIKSIRDMQIRIRTASVVAECSLTTAEVLTLRREQNIADGKIEWCHKLGIEWCHKLGRYIQRHSDKKPKGTA